MTRAPIVSPQRSVLLRASAKLALSIVTFAVLGLLVGCSKSSSDTDDCQRVIDKSSAVLEELLKRAGKQQTDEQRAKVIEKCRAALKAGRREPMMDCVLAAADDDAIRKCYAAAASGYRQDIRAMDASIWLTTLGNNAKAYFATAGAFPKGTVALTPAIPCCRQRDQMCKVDPSEWQDPVWQQLALAVALPQKFQYSYASDGATFKATAVGDPDCGGQLLTYVVTGTIENGKPSVTKPLRQ